MGWGSVPGCTDHKITLSIFYVGLTNLEKSVFFSHFLSQNKVCGLCGNFDGIENNDLTSSKNQVENNPSNFGNSWKVKPFCADVAMVSIENSLWSFYSNSLRNVVCLIFFFFKPIKRKYFYFRFYVMVYYIIFTFFCVLLFIYL